MTTKESPLRVLKSQAERIAKSLAAFERGEAIDVRFAERLKAARDKEIVKIGIVMDDKIITIDMPWTVIKSSGEVAMAEYLLNMMRESRNTVQ